MPEDSKLVLERAIAHAHRAAKPHLNPACFDFVRDVLLLMAPPHVFARQREARLSFVMRWQQFTGPNRRQGRRRYHALCLPYPLVSLNEVGGNAQPLCRYFARTVSRFSRRTPIALASQHECKQHP